MVSLNELKPNKVKESKRRVGRGGKRGKTSGRGHKGQKQHGGHGIRPEMRDFIKKLPKLRGYGKNRAKTVNSDEVPTQTVSTDRLNTFKSGNIVSPKTLVEAGLVELRGGKFPQVKLLVSGELKTKLTVEGCGMSASARGVIEAVGGEVK